MRKILALAAVTVITAVLCSCGTEITMPEDENENGSIIYVSPADSSGTETVTEDDITTTESKADMKFFVSIN